MLLPSKNRLSFYIIYVIIHSYVFRVNRIYIVHICVFYIIT
nr:MAG TPA: hypothetical protein [Bacteriophage sp.]